ncbi:MAG TPA: hypothetical protein VII63_07010 [Caulobacteraceae bacterium]
MNDIGYSVIRLDQRTGEPFSSALSAEAGVRASGPASLATSPALAHAALVILCCGPVEADLATFARLVRRQPSGEGPILVVVSEDGAFRMDDCCTENVRDVFGPLDGAAYAAAMPRAARPLEGRLVASVAIEVAAWDVSLLDLLTVLPIERAVRPDLCVESWDDGRKDGWRGVPLAWERGCLDSWGGEDAEHALWLAANKPAVLTKRVWRGQLTMMLPWIERQRLSIIEQERRTLRPDPIRSGPDVESLDWGPLSAQLERVPNLKRLLEVFREGRNELAHGRPLTWAQINACLVAASGRRGPATVGRGA